MEKTEVFWVIKNGVRMTGMPAFGKGHRDEHIWSMVSFVKSLPRMSPEEYRGWTEKASVVRGGSGKR
ncbi:c-type cytochrome [Geomonas sp. Red276]